MGDLLQVLRRQLKFNSVFYVNHLVPPGQGAGRREQWAGLDNGLGAHVPGSVCGRGPGSCSSPAPAEPGSPSARPISLLLSAVVFQLSLLHRFHPGARRRLAAARREGNMGRARGPALFILPERALI